MDERERESLRPASAAELKPTACTSLSIWLIAAGLILAFSLGYLTHWIRARSLRVAVVAFVIIVIFFAVAFVFLFVFLVWLLSKDDIGNDRPIRSV